MKGKGLGWLLLVGALAVPAVLFFKWWTQMKATQGSEARQAVPASAPFGTTASPEAKTPEEPQEPAPAEPPAQAAAPAPEAAPMTSEAALPGPTARPPAEEAASPAPEPAAAEPAPPETRAGGQPLLAYMPKTTRDPMLSVFDVRELMRRKEAERLAREQMQRAAEEIRRPPKVSAPPARPLCDTLELQGIIGTGGDVSAIVNDQIVREGDVVDGALVERVTTRTVVFKKGRKTCMKRVTK